MDSLSLLYTFGKLIQEDSTTLVYHGQRSDDNLPVVLKLLRPEAALPEEARRFRREYDLLAGLDLPGVIKVFGLHEHDGAPMIVMEDIGGESLDRLFRGTLMPLVQFPALASGLADTLDGLHRRGIIHKDISPAHIIYNSVTGQFRLVGFGMADELPQRTVTLQPPSALEGTLAYLSPEQTGRMNRSVDYRTDFYSLGATFYFLLTNRPPFAADDALGMVHCHLAATPAAPHEVNPAVPTTISRIVMKLLAKPAEDRYQSGQGLKADLDRCGRGLEEMGEIADFEPGKEDVIDRLRIPQKLYGREPEIARLLAALERVCAGESELLLVAGSAGVGKTSLVHEAYRPMLERRGYFIEGKFDQLQRAVPYSGWGRAFSGFVAYLLMESEAELAQWRRDILQAVGRNGRVLTEVIPNLELIIGAQPPVPALGGIEAQNRFNYVFLELVRVIAKSGRPLVVFLDDLQWIDAASVGLALTLLRGGIGHVLVIGAYRANEVDTLHPLSRAIEALRKERGEIGLLSLENLPQETVNELIADALQCERARTAALSRIVHAKTGGNPFFTIQVLETLAERNVLSYDAVKRRWQWDDAALVRIELAGNVVALMVAKIATLPPGTREVLPQAACLGYHFDLRDVGVIAGLAEALVRERLLPALAEGLIVPSGGRYQFAHDRVRQAAYSLIPEAGRKRVHLDIGRLLMQQLAEGDREERFFTIVDQLNEGLELIDQDEEKRSLARMNLQAGERARASAAYAAAAHYLNLALGLLPPGSWRDDYELMLAVHKDGAENEYLAGNHERADALIDTALEHAATPVDKAGIYAIQVVIHTTQNRFGDAISVGLRALALLGAELPDPSDEAALRSGLARELGRYHDNRDRVGLQSLLDAPAMSEAAAAKCMEILMHLALVTYFANYDLFALLTTRMANLSLTRGSASSSALAYALMAMVSIAREGDYRSAAELGRLALALHEKQGTLALEGKILMFYANCVDPWFHHVNDGLAIQKRGFQAAVDSGSLNDALNCLWGEFRNLLFGSAPLDDTRKKCQEGIAFAEKIHDQIFRQGLVFSKHVLACFQGGLDDPAALSSPEFDERGFLATIQALNWQALIAHYHIFKTWTLFVYDRVDEALSFAEATVNMTGFIGDQPHIALHFIHHALLLSRRYAELVPEKQEEALAAIKKDLEILGLWAENCPENFLHYRLLGDAELARITGRDPDALRLYDEALAVAEKREAFYIGGVTGESAARFWLSRDKADFAEVYARRAHRAYSRWQAWGKVKALEAEYPHWFGNKTGVCREPEKDRLDIESVMKATSAISREMELDRLLGAVLRIVIENAGAQQGCLLQERDGTWMVSARGKIDAKEIELPPCMDLNESDLVAPGVVRFVARTRDRVVLEDAANEGSFVSDTHIAREKTRSLLCAPLLSRGQLVGILYLQNNLATRVFTEERVRFLEMILSQVAISLENARIYGALRESEARFRRLTENARDVIYRMALPDGRYEYVSAAARELFGHAPEEFYASPELFRKLIHPDWQAYFVDSWSRLMQGEMPPTYEYQIIRDSGDVRWLNQRNILVRDDAGRIVAIEGIVTDVTERKSSEEKLRKLNEELDHRVKERTAEIEKKNAELERMNKLFVGRELKMVELKERIRELEAKSGIKGIQNA